jgi:hypothetical protein
LQPNISRAVAMACLGHVLVMYGIRTC